VTEPDLSVVVPVYNEAAVLDELVARCRAALEATGWPHEVIIADDHSTDATAEKMAELADGEVVRHVRLPENRGQFGATVAGLAEMRGTRAIVLDGDLQDPPEVITELVAAHDLTGGHEDVIYGIKRDRDDPPWFRLGRALFGWVSTLGEHQLPPGAGSYCLMRVEVARAVVGTSMTHLNLASLLSLLAHRLDVVVYDKAARYDDASRVGPSGLALEAIGSLVLTGAMERLLLVVVFLEALAAGALAWFAPGICGMVCVAAGWALWGGAMIGVVWAGVTRRRVEMSLPAVERGPGDR